MEFKQAKQEFEAFKKRLDEELQQWQSLTARLDSQASIGEAISELAKDQQKNVERLRNMAASFRNLGAVVVDGGAIGTLLAQRINSWLTSIDAEVTGIEKNLESLVPDFTIDKQPVDDGMQLLKERFEEKTAAVASVIGERMSEARERIEENLNAAVKMLVTATEEMSEGIGEALNDAREALNEMWEETAEGIVANDGAIDSQGSDLKETLAAAVSGAVDRVTGQLGSVNEAVDRLLGELRRTLDNVERTLELVNEVTEGTSLGTKGATTSLDAVRQTLSAVA